MSFYTSRGKESQALQWNDELKNGAGLVVVFVFPLSRGGRKKWVIDSRVVVRFSVSQRLPRTIPSIPPHAATPPTRRLKSISIFIHSIIYFCLFETACGYFLTVCFVSIISSSAFITREVTTFFVSAMQMVRLVLARSLLSDINKSVMSQLAFIFVKMTIICYTP